jgi:hypothetical protein
VQIEPFEHRGRPLPWTARVLQATDAINPFESKSLAEYAAVDGYYLSKCL